MLTISQKRFFVSLDELALFMERDKILNDRMGVHRAWGQKGHLPPGGNWDYEPNISEKN